MAHTITIEYTPVKTTNNNLVAQICSIFSPDNAAADLEVFKDSYYDTNVKGFGEGTSLEEFMSQMVAYPGLNAYLREAVREKQYQFETDDEDLFLFLRECAIALKEQGFKITFTS